MIGSGSMVAQDTGSLPTGEPSWPDRRETVMVAQDTGSLPTAEPSWPGRRETVMVAQDTGSLRTARPSWPGRGEKVAPPQEGGPAWAPVPVLGAAYARGAQSVRQEVISGTRGRIRPVLGALVLAGGVAVV